jgi:hypothetical protein
MKGIWHGKYSYNYNGNSTETIFVIDINEFDGYNFLGIVEDDEQSGGTPGKGQITDTFKNGIVSFKKQMPILSVILKNGKMKKFPKKHIPIFYTGKLTNESDISGEWVMKSKLIINKFIIGLGIKTKGTWTMKKSV